MRAMTDPIQTGYHPRNVKNTVVKNETNVIETSGFLPFVAITTTTSNPIENMIENMIPACVWVVSKACAILSRYELQITIEL